MGIEVLDRSNGKDKHCRMLFMCDTEADIADLPTEEKSRLMRKVLCKWKYSNYY